MPETMPSRKTKTELLEDYRRLQEKYDELKITAALVYDPKNAELMEKVGDYSADTITASIAALKTSVNGTLNDLTEKLLAEAQKFVEIRKAIDISKKNLELNFNVQVAAETLHLLLQEYRTKQFELTEEITNKKRDWQRDQEEYEYAAKRQRGRSEEEYQDLHKKREQELIDREQCLREREEELKNLHSEADSFQVKMDKACAQREVETTKRLRDEHEQKLSAEKKDWTAQKNIYEMRLVNLEENIKRQNAEIASLKLEAERAGKKAQELAVKVIESGARTLPREEESAAI